MEIICVVSCCVSRGHCQGDFAVFWLKKAKRTFFLNINLL